ncbi:high affinity nickel transport protein nic1 [Metarhizium album ARSEF 1941]|uniref:Nickel/cobalt efflux system n=1 Tax=Metarhizium album (strain ARSEF 1941) TaxID=1081103 RepID=A0A0B2X1W2_METAS|nr:high affinity nickel transport protein nic1 [Metarhizium album ARSEF 1941]KHN99712.1 high affinity nickel transport protein nic1 [Metarhizium album ARSEF 1941]
MKLTLPPRPGFLSGVPSNAIAIVGLLVTVNLLIWASIAIVLHYHPALISAAALSYTLGLRHALDADHISAIDLMTRRLVSLGQRPATVGTFFSLGHSTIVIVTCVVVAATSGALRDRFDGFTRVGNIIGTAVSATVLIVLCVANAFILHSLVRKLQLELQRRRAPAALHHDASQHHHLHVEGGGVLVRVFKFLFKAVDRPWKMYPLGVVFGLGFDTSSEVAILGIASLQALKGTSIWLILIFPILFTSGMCLIDTTDGAAMVTLYSSKAFSRDLVALLYYQIVLSGITVLVSAFIGIIQLLSLIQNVADPEGSFWDGVGAIGDHFDIVGGSICGVFLLVGIVSIVLYRPWRRRIDRQTRGLTVAEDESQDGSEGPASPFGQPAVPQSATAT